MSLSDDDDRIEVTLHIGHEEFRETMLGIVGETGWCNEFDLHRYMESAFLGEFRDAVEKTKERLIKEGIICEAGGGTGGYMWVMVKSVTPEYIQRLVRRSEGVQLMQEMSGDATFKRAFDAATEGALAQHLIFRYGHCFFTTEEGAEEYKTKLLSRRIVRSRPKVVSANRKRSR